MLKTIALAAALTIAILAGLVAVEIVLALTRDYLPTAPAMELGGTFGPSDGEPLDFVVLGDSTAAGLGAGSPQFAYPTVLSQRLGDEGWRVTLKALGVSGARVEDILEEQVPFALEASPDLVFIGIGANDVTHVTGLGRIAADMNAALELLEGSGATIVVAGPPDMRAHAWLEPLRSLAGWRGRRVAATIEAVATRRGHLVVPLAAGAGPYFASNPEDAYGDDGFHPGPGGYRAWADAIFPVLAEALARREE